MVDFSKINNIKIEMDDKQKSENATPKDNKAQNLWDDLGGEITQTLMGRGNSKEDSEVLATKYINYASETLKEDKDGNGLTFDEWKNHETRYDWLGIDTTNRKEAEKELKKIYDSVAGLDKDAGKLGAKELVAFAMYADAMNSEKSKDGNLSLDGETKLENPKEVNGGKKAYSEHLKDVADGNGKEVLKGLYESTFSKSGTQTKIDEAGRKLRASFQENIDNNEMTEEEVNKVVNGMTDYLTATMKQKDTDSSGAITEEEYFASHTGTYSALGLVNDDGSFDTERGHELFQVLDLDGDGKLNVEELSVQYMFREITSKDDKLANLDGGAFDASALDGQIHMKADAKGHGIANNLTKLLQMGGNLEERQNELRSIGRNFGLIDENYGRKNVDNTQGTGNTPDVNNTQAAEGNNGNNSADQSSAAVTADATEAYEAINKAETGLYRYIYRIEEAGDTHEDAVINTGLEFDPSEYTGTSFVAAGANDETYKNAALELAQAYMSENDTSHDNKISKDEFIKVIANKLRDAYGLYEPMQNISDEDYINKYSSVSLDDLYKLYDVNQDSSLDLNEIATYYMSLDAQATSNKTLEFDGNIDLKLAMDFQEVGPDAYRQFIYNRFFKNDES